MIDTRLSNSLSTYGRCLCAAAILANNTFEYLQNVKRYLFSVLHCCTACRADRMLGACANRSFRSWETPVAHTDDDGRGVAAFRQAVDNPARVQRLSGGLLRLQTMYSRHLDDNTIYCWPENGYEKTIGEDEHQRSVSRSIRHYNPFTGKSRQQADSTTRERDDELWRRQ